MTDKELRKLNRAQLLEMLIEQSKEVASLKEQLKEANKKLENRQIMIENSGSIAEAALRLNGVFEAAQNAAEQYLENIKNQSDVCYEAYGKDSDPAENSLPDTNAE